MSDQERTRYFEYMRPRYNNPSFASSNVGASLGMLYISENIKPSPIMKMSSMPESEPQPSASKIQASQHAPPPQSNHRRSKSLLSNYGTTSLGSLPKFVNERDIYQKQQKKYNIITIQPKQYNQTIKKYPKYRLENIDQNYYKKLKLQDQYNQAWTKAPFNRQTDSNPEYTNVNKQSYNNIQESLNNKLSLRNQSKDFSEVKVQKNQANEIQQQSKAFRPKMLNNIDELDGVL